MDGLHQLRAKLCRELAQSERSAEVHTRREARRLGDVPPAAALLALGAHAHAMRPRLQALASRRQAPQGLQLGRLIGQVFSALRHLLADRMIDVERSYRGTLLGLRHGMDVTRLLREVALRCADQRLALFCEEWLAEREQRMAEAERQLAWFADVPRRALQSGLRAALAAR